MPSLLHADFSEAVVEPVSSLPLKASTCDRERGKPRRAPDQAAACFALALPLRPQLLLPGQTASEWDAACYIAVFTKRTASAQASRNRFAMVGARRGWQPSYLKGCRLLQVKRCIWLVMRQGPKADEQEKVNSSAPIAWI